MSFISQFSVVDPKEPLECVCTRAKTTCGFSDACCSSNQYCDATHTSYYDCYNNAYCGSWTSCGC